MLQIDSPVQVPNRAKRSHPSLIYFNPLPDIAMTKMVSKQMYTMKSVAAVAMLFITALVAQVNSQDVAAVLRQRRTLFQVDQLLTSHDKEHNSMYGELDRPTRKRRILDPSTADRVSNKQTDAAHGNTAKLSLESGWTMDRYLEDLMAYDTRRLNLSLSLSLSMSM